MEDKNIKKDNIFPVCVNFDFDNFYEYDKEFIAQYTKLSSEYFEGLYRKYNCDPAVLYALLSSKQLSKLKDNFDYKSTFNEILFSEKINVDYDRLVLLYEVFCWNILYKKMLADELSEQKENNADNLEQDERKEQDKRNKRYNLRNEIMKTAFYKNLFDELIYNLVEFKNDEDVIKFLFEKTFVFSDDENNKDKFIELEKEILDCVKQVNEKKHPIICIANADNVDVAKNKDKYNEYTFVQWKKWDSLPEFEKAHEKKSPDVKLDDVLSVGDDKIFGKEEIKSIKDDKPQETKKLLFKHIDDYLVEEDVEYKNFFTLIDYYLDFCSKERNWQAYSANRQLFVAKKRYLWHSISSHLKVIFQNDRCDDFVDKFNNKFIENEKINCKDEAEKTEIVNIIGLSSTVQYGRIMTYDGDQYKLNDNDIYRNLLDNSQSNCLDWLGGDLFRKHWVDVIENELEYKNLCKEIIFKKDTSALDAKDLSLIFEVFLFNVLYKKISNINLSKDNDEIIEDLRNIWDEKIENSILNQGLFDKFRRNIVNFKDEDDVIKFLYKETFYGIKDVDDNEILSTRKKEILKCVEVLKNNKAPLVFFTDNKFVKEKYSSEKYKPCRIFVWERKDNLLELREKTTMSLKENIKDVLCAFDDYIFGIDNKKDKNEIKLPIENKTDEKAFIEEQNDNPLLYAESSENKNTIIDSNIENKKMDYLLLFESIGDYLNEFNFDLDDGTAVSENKDKNDQLTPEQKVNNNFIDLIEYYCSFCAKKELIGEYKLWNQQKLFCAKKSYLSAYISRMLLNMLRHNEIGEFVSMFCSKFIENHKIKANNEAEKRGIADFIDWLDRQGAYPYDKSYFVIFGDEIYPTSIKYTETIQNLDIFFDIDEDKCTIKLKSEEFRSAIYNVLNRSGTICRTELFKNFYNRVMQDKNLSPEQKQERLNKIMPQLLKFISIYELIDKTKMDYNDDPICYCVDFDRFNELTDCETPVDNYVYKLWVDIQHNGVNYYHDNYWNIDYIKILGVIKKMVDDKQLILREDNVQVIKLLIKEFLLVDESFANSLKRKYLQAFLKKTDVNDIKESGEFKILTLAFEIVSKLIADNKEHEVKKFFDDEIKKLFGINKHKNFLLGFLDTRLCSKPLRRDSNKNNDPNDAIDQYISQFNNVLQSTSIDLVIKLFNSIEPNFDLGISMCERLIYELETTQIITGQSRTLNGFKPTTEKITPNDTVAFESTINLFSILLSNDDFKLDSKEKQNRVYVLYLKIIDFGYNIEKSKDAMKKIQSQIKAKIYDESTFNLLKDNSEVMSKEKFKDGSELYYTQKFLKPLFKFKHWIDIVINDKDFFGDFIAGIVFNIESNNYKGDENDKNKFYDIYNIKSLTGYKSFQNNKNLFISKLLEFGKQRQREFIFDTDLFLKLANNNFVSLLNKNYNYEFLFQSDFTFILPINEITADNVNNAFQLYSQKLNKNFEGKKGNEHQKLKDDFLGLFAKSLVGHCELILSDKKYHKSKNKDELKNDYIKTIATFCRDKETKIIRSVLENCTRTAEEQKNKSIKPYAIIEALLNDENFKLDADKTALIIEWFIKHNVNELEIKLKENETYDKMHVIDKLFKKIKEVKLDYTVYNKLLSGKFHYHLDKLNKSYNTVSSVNPNLYRNPEDLIAYRIGNGICDELNFQLQQDNKKIIKHNQQFQNNLTGQDTNLMQNNRNDNINNNVSGNASINPGIEGDNKKTSPLLKIIKWISFALITIAGLILVLNSFIHMFSLSLFLSIPLILACIILDMALFESGRKILKSILKCILCRYTETDNNIGKNNYQKKESLISSNQNKTTVDNNNIDLIKLKETEKNNN